jgi:uncharacterized protein (DUF2267 family)
MTFETAAQGSAERETAMQYETFVQEVRLRTGLKSNWEAIDAARAVLETLFECLPGALAEDVAAHLPCNLRSGLNSLQYTSGEQMTVREFLSRVARREGTADAAAFCHAQAVLQMLGAALGFDLLERVRAEMPTEFDELWGVDPARAHMHQPVG